jgi:hypothetical protein
LNFFTRCSSRETRWTRHVACVAMVKKFIRIISRKPEERDPTGYFDIFGRIIFNPVKRFVYKSTNQQNTLYLEEIPDRLYFAKSFNSINKRCMLLFVY